MPWKYEGASCWGIDTEYFFPEKGALPEEVKMAIKICGTCNWQAECLNYSLHYRVEGIWAGTTPTHRDRLRNKLKIIAKPITNERAK